MIADIFGSAPSGRVSSGRPAPASESNRLAPCGAEQAAIAAFERLIGALTPPGRDFQPRTRETELKFIGFVWAYAPEVFENQTYVQLCKSMRWTQPERRIVAETILIARGQYAHAVRVHGPSGGSHQR